MRSAAKAKGQAQASNQVPDASTDTITMFGTGGPIDRPMTHGEMRFSKYIVKQELRRTLANMLRKKFPNQLCAIMEVVDEVIPITKPPNVH